MNKTVTINLSGQVFTIDEDAYDKLKSYLDSIHARFTGTEGADEIMADIEARLAEMFASYLGDRKNVISAAHVDQAMQVMGRPEDFGDVDEGKTTTSSSSSQSQGAFRHRVGKKLYRDEDNKVLGGVISGLCAYFGIDDPVWLRLAVAILFFVSGGTIFLIYILLWIIVPAAVTASQKLEMRGEPINIDNIERTIREDIEDIKRRISNIDQHSARDRARGILASIGLFFIAIFRVLFHFIRGVLGMGIVIVGLAVLIVMIWSWWIPGQQLFSAYHLLPYFFDSQKQITLALTGIGLLVIIPILAFVLLGFRLLFHRTFRGNGIGGTLAALWVLGWILTPIALASHHKDFEFRKDKTEQISVTVPSGKMLKLVAINDKSNIADQYQRFMEFGPFRLAGDSIYETGNDNLKLDIEKSDKDFYIEKVIMARGASGDEALAHASHVVCSVSQVDSTLYFVNNLRYPANDKIRNQKVHITVYVPEGDSVYLDASMMDIMYDVKNVTHTYDGDMLGHVWTMRPEGLTCVACKDLNVQDGNREKVAGNIHQYTPGDFTRIKVDGIFDVNIRRGDNIKVEMTGPEEATKKVEVRTSGSTLNISSEDSWFDFFHRRRDKNVVIDITVPKLESVSVGGGANLSMKDFTGDEMDIEVSGTSHADIDAKVDKLELEGSGASSVALTGRANELKADISGASSLEAFEFEVHSAEVEATGASHANVKVTEKLDAEVSGASNIQYDGSPTISSNSSGFSSIKPRR